MNSNTSDRVPDNVDAKADQGMDSSGKQTTMGDMTGSTEGEAQNVKAHGKESSRDIGAMFTKLGHNVEGTFKGVFNALSGKSSGTSSGTSSGNKTDDMEPTTKK